MLSCFPNDDVLVVNYKCIYRYRLTDADLSAFICELCSTACEHIADTHKTAMRSVAQALLDIVFLFVK